MSDIGLRISEFVRTRLYLEPDLDLAATPSFLQAGIIDSTGVLELVQFLEETWQITISDEELVPANLDSLARLEAFVQRKLGG